METFQLDDFKYNFVNMTAFRMVDLEDVAVHQTLKDMLKFEPTAHKAIKASLHIYFLNMVIFLCF